jgi:hypothetical protein
MVDRAFRTGSDSANRLLTIPMKGCSRNVPHNARNGHPRKDVMKAWKTALPVACLVSLVAATEAQTNVRVRGTIVAIEGNVLSVKSRGGRDLKLQLAGSVTVAAAKALRFKEIRQGDYVSTTTKPAADGTLVAPEVHYLAPTTPEGNVPWDLRPGPA